MTQSFITLGLIAFLVVTHILAWKWSAFIQEKYASDPKKRRIAIFLLFMSMAVLFWVTAAVLLQTSF